MPDVQNLVYSRNEGGLSVNNNSGTVNTIIRTSEEKRTSGSLDAQAKKCRKALFLTDPYIDRRNMLDSKGDIVQGTCEWINSDPAYMEWADGNSRGLWIRGGPGKRKSMVALLLTRQLEDNAEMTAVPVLFYFIDHRDGKRNTAPAVLLGLLHELLEEYPQLSTIMHPHLEHKRQRKVTLKSRDGLWSLLEKAFRQPGIGPLHCVLDGLDECKDSDSVWLARKISSLVSQSGGPTVNDLNVIVLSRHMQGLNNFRQIDLDANLKHTVRDLQLFIDTKLEGFHSIPGYTEKFHDSIRKELLRRCEGLFLWLGLVMSELRDKFSCTEIERALESIPSDLAALYNRMLRDIREPFRAQCAAMIRLVVLAAKPLTLDILGSIMGIHGTARVSAKQRYQEVFHACGPLLCISDKEPSTSREKSGAAVFVHQSLEDHLIRPEVLSDGDVSEFYIDEIQGHFDLARNLRDKIRALCQQARREYQSFWDCRDLKVLEEFPFAEYATCYWRFHKDMCNTHRDFEELCLKLQFRSDDEKLERLSFLQVIKKSACISPASRELEEIEEDFKRFVKRFWKLVKKILVRWVHVPVEDRLQMVQGIKYRIKYMFISTKGVLPQDRKLRKLYTADPSLLAMAYMRAASTGRSEVAEQILQMCNPRTREYCQTMQERSTEYPWWTLELYALITGDLPGRDPTSGHFYNAEHT